MSPNSQSEYRSQFNRAIDHAIKECSRKTAITTLEEVYEYLKKSAESLIGHLTRELVDEQIRVLIQKRLKRCTVSLQEAHETMMRDGLQGEFDFFEMEQFRGVGKRISCPTGNGRIEYVEYNRSTERQRLLSIEHLSRGISADTARCEAEIASNDWLHPLVKKYGDLPAEQLVELWRKERGSNAEASHA